MTLAELIGRVIAAWTILRHGLRKPKPAKRAGPAPAAGEPVAPAPATPRTPPYQRITVKELDHVRGVAHCEDWSAIKLCRGPARGCKHYPRAALCDDCFVVAWHEKRSSAEILAQMERGDA